VGPNTLWHTQSKFWVGHGLPFSAPMESAGCCKLPQRGSGVAFCCIVCSQNASGCSIFTVRRSLHGLSYRNSVRPSVCPSVCPSVTLVHCVHMVRPTTMIFSPYGSPIILVSGDIKLIQKFEGDHPERGR